MAPAVLVGGGATVRPIEEASTSASAGGATPLPREEGPPPERTLKELQDLIARFEQCQRDGDAEGAKSILKGFFEYFVPPEAPGDERKTLPPLVETPQPKREETFRVSHTEFRMLAYTLGDFFNLIGDGRGSDFARRHPAMLPSSEPREISALDRDLRLLLARAAMKAGNPREAVRFFGRRDSPEIMSSEITAIRAALKWVFGEKETAMEGFRFLVEMTPEFSHPETIQALPWSEGARAILTELRREALK